MKSMMDKMKAYSGMDKMKEASKKKVKDKIVAKMKAMKAKKGEKC